VQNIDLAMDAAAKDFRQSFLGRCSPIWELPIA